MCASFFRCYQHRHRIRGIVIFCASVGPRHKHSTLSISLSLSSTNQRMVPRTIMTYAMTSITMGPLCQIPSSGFSTFLSTAGSTEQSHWSDTAAEEGSNGLNLKVPVFAVIITLVRYCRRGGEQRAQLKVPVFAVKTGLNYRVLV